MVRKFWVPLALLALMSGPVTAQTGAPDARAVLQAADGAMGASNLRSIQYSGTGYITSPGQSYTAALNDTWPRFDLTYTRTIDYDTHSYREEQLRVQGTWPLRGGGFRPITGERRQVELVSGNYAWDLDAQNQPVAELNDVELRQMEIILTPHGFIKAALAAPDARVHVQIENSRTTRTVNIVTFNALGKYPTNAWFNQDNLLVRTQTWLPHQLLGDVYVETRYTNYQDFDGTMFPTDMHRSWGNPPHPGFELTIYDVQPNVAGAALQVPDAVRNAVAEPVLVVSEQLAPGVWFLGGGSHNSMAIEFQDYSVIIEGPQNDARGRAVIDETRRLIPGKPVRYVLNTHHHFDHSGGLRPFAADDIVVITHESNFNFYEGVIFDLRPRTLKTDALSLAPRQVHYVLVEDNTTLTNGDRTMEIVRVEDIDHAGDMLVAFLPEEGILVEADLFSARGGVPDRPPTNHELALYHTIKRQGWDVVQIVPIHGEPVSFADFLRLVGGPQQAAEAR